MLGREPCEDRLAWIDWQQKINHNSEPRSALLWGCRRRRRGRVAMGDDGSGDFRELRGGAIDAEYVDPQKEQT